MKNLIFMLSLFTLIACNKTDEQKIVKNLRQYYDIETPDTTGLGAIIYSFDCRSYDKSTYKFIYDDPLVMEPKIKGAVDRALNTLPIKTRDRYYSQFSGNMLCSYEWENLQTKVIMENHFKTAYDTPVIYLHVKIWITNK